MEERPGKCNDHYERKGRGGEIIPLYYNYTSVMLVEDACNTLTSKKSLIDFFNLLLEVSDNKFLVFISPSYGVVESISWCVTA